MKKQVLFITALFFLLALLSQCNPSHHHRSVAKQTVHCYKQHKDNSDGTSSFIFWYLIMSSNNQCYYCSSPTQLSNYNNVQWTETTTNPVADIKTGDLNELPGMQVSEQELSAEMQIEMESNPDNFGGMTEDEMGDYEGGENSSGAENSDAGGDSGGGDSGGGDGGGGE